MLFQRVKDIYDKYSISKIQEIKDKCRIKDFIKSYLHFARHGHF